MNNNRNILLKRIYLMLTMLFGVANLQLSIFNSQLGVAFAQDPAPAPKIGGNVYGGGNQGNVDGSTKVTLRAGDIGVRPDDANPNQGLDNPKGKVFGGARMANVGGNTLVNVDGENVSGYVLANYVFGGNDIAGTIGTAAAVGEELPTELKVATENEVDNTWNSYVRISTPSTKRTVHEIDDEGNVASSASEKIKEIYIGQLFAGGNGDYDYDPVIDSPVIGQTTHYVYNKGDHTTPIAQKVTLNGQTGFVKPSLLKTYLEVVGGSIVYAYGGGNDVTVEEKTVIHVNNPSKVVNHIEETTDGGTTWKDLLVTGRFLDMGINIGFSYPSSGAFQIGRFFGGNNSEDMDIRPTWKLKRGKIRNLYSGGNKGAMTHPNGIYLEIPENCYAPVPVGQTLTKGEEYYTSATGDGRFIATGSEPPADGTNYYGTLVVDYLYGGCRMGDVRPQTKTWNATEGKYDYEDVTEVNNDITGTKFPRNLAARVLIKGGDVNNVYGGNDVRGKVYFGNAVGIYANVRGNVFGGGNGAYPYTDNPTLANDPTYGDFYYDHPGKTAAEGLLDVRPNAEQVSILLRGTETKPTIIHGSVFVGGDCATLKTDATHENLPNYPLAELKMGSYVKTQNIFLGNNGEGMVTTNAREETHTGGLLKNEGVLRTYRRTDIASNGQQYNSMNLLETGQMNTYMDGVVMDHIPSFILEDSKKGDPYDYEPYSSYVGSLFYGGNRGSMAYGETNTIDLENMTIYLYDKLVGGCNNGNVAASSYNAAYQGGILGTTSERIETSGQTAFQRQHKDRIVMNLSLIKIKPMRWNDTFELVTSSDADIIAASGKLKAGETYYATPLRSSAFIADGTETVATPATYYRLMAKGTELVWNTAKWDVDENDFVPIGTENTAEDQDRRLLNGNVYGGCYTSGHVNGNTVINIDNDLIDKSENFAESTEDAAGNRTITGARNSGVILDNQGDDVMTVALAVFGAGCGADTEIWGSTTVNHNKGYCFQIFGGGEEGMVGKSNPNGTYTINGKKYIYTADYSSTVNLKGPNPGYSEESSGPALAECEYIYGGGNEGSVSGDCYVYLGNGRIYDAFGGASNADILGGTEVHIGHDGGFPWIRDNIYGGNDFGGTIRGFRNHLAKVRTRSGDGKPLMFKLSNTGEDDQDYALAFSGTFVNYIQGRVDSIFGGSYGFYDYKDPIFKDYTYSTGEAGIPTGKQPGSPREGTGFHYPHLVRNSFVFFQPANNSLNEVGYIFGGSEGLPGHPHLNNTMQEASYVHIDDVNTTNEERYAEVDVYGGGAYAGLGSEETLGGGRAVVDLLTGKINNVYGGSNQEGLIGITRVNVPEESVIKVNSLFGGGKGYDAAKIAAKPALAARFCDHYVTCIDYRSRNAIVSDGIYGGNHNCRIAFDTYVNMCAPAYSGYGSYTTTVYGGGYGSNTVSGRTNIYMNKGSDAYKVFGGGRSGDVFNFESLKRWLGVQFAAEGGDASVILPKVKDYGHTLQTFKNYINDPAHYDHFVKLPSEMPTYNDNIYYDYSGGVGEIDLRDQNFANPNTYYNTNVRIMQGGNVNGYAYGGGYGEDAVVGGTTYVELKGGNVDRDIYGGGEGGTVQDYYGLVNDGNPNTNFVASTNVYIEGGMVRNIYGGGYLGHVGKHTGDISTPYTADIPAVANVIIGLPEEGLPTNPIPVGGDGFDADFSFHNGIPAILRNAYGGGKGGSVYGTTNLNIYNGYIGYRYKGFLAVPNTTKLTKGETYYTSADGEGKFTATGDETSTGSNYYQLTYAEELADGGAANALDLAGNAFGGGYVVNSYVDIANVNMYGGTVRGCLYGGGEVGPIGRGTTKPSSYTTGLANGNVRIFKAGKTNVKLYDGLVKRNVFGGGRGKDSWGGEGTLYMDADVVSGLRSSGLFNKGYVFGQTEVDIYGGEVGTDEGVALGYGNVFGGGDIGFIYSAYEKTDGTLLIGKKVAGSKRYDGTDEGYYYKSDGTNFVDDDGTALVGSAEKHLTEDCKVVVEPWCKAKSDVTINGVDYSEGDYVPTSALNYLGNKSASSSEWAALGKVDVNKEGVIIHNAVFAGGNTSPGSMEMYANSTAIFGNATASIHDVYNRDLISIGRGRVGGLYGDGNLTLVDGYRELNITNYGTDYYHITPEITLTEYNALPIREAAYYEIRYKCLIECTDNTGKTYAVGSTITADEMLNVFDGVNVTVGTETVSMITSDGKPQPTYWKENGVCSRYAGRPMNTIQRADFCGVFGSRMVMRGAQDRVPETVDYTNYTINRVREVSLNKKVSLRTADASDDRNKEHGNYFGIYSVVNFFGALTSDLDFHTAKRVTDNTDATTYKCAANGYDYGNAAATYSNWKDAFKDDRRRNNGNSHNKLALASGVYLELTTEKSTGTGLYEKDWGYITGVVELDLINVQPGMGGGYVYAKNEHGIRSGSGKTHTILTSLNTGAVTNKQFNYDETEANKKEWETSGNFINSTQTIIDDCYNIGDKYKSGYMPPDGVPAHYWYIRGSVYVYDQYISAFTGSPNAYSEIVSMPLTITSASHGKLKLLNVQPNLYAYYSVHSSTSGGTTRILGENDRIEIRDKEYGRNDAINYWDWVQLANTEKNLFVEETYVVTADCTYGTGTSAVTYTAGTVLLPGKTDGTEPDTYYYLKAHAPQKDLDATDTDTSTTPYVHHVGKNKDVAFDDVFRPSNNVSHDTGYILTYTIDNPSQWNKWYTDVNSTTHVKDQTENGAADEDGPTYYPIASGLYGQNDYTVGNIITKDVYDTYQDVKTNHSSVIPSGQAVFNTAYVVTVENLEATNKNGTPQLFHKGATLSKEDYIIYDTDGTTIIDQTKWDAISGSVAEAYMATNTIQLSSTEYIYRNTFMTAAEKAAYKATATSAGNTELANMIDGLIVPAYYCTQDGKYGGNYFEENHNYRGLQTWSSLSETDRAQFRFNYDALDLLIDPLYSKDASGVTIYAEGQKYQYDSAAGNITGAEANSAHYSLQTPIDYSATYKGSDALTYTADDNTSKTATDGTELSRTEYERLPNEQYYYAPITVGSTSETYYVVKETIVLGDLPYAAGQVIPKDTYDGLGTTDKAKVDELTFASTGTYYYCREGYSINTSIYTDTNKGAVTDIISSTNYTSTVPAGIVISSADYGNLINKQTNFAIHGLAPTETSTLYVTRNSDILDLSAEKIITVIYQYDYVESDMSGAHITPVSERHILNIHLNFMSGIPTVEDIQIPDIILPGTTITIPEPYVTPGAYEITGGGWKLFDTEGDAESHINGIEYTPVSDPLYLYQNNHYMAYYAKTVLGETYSNYVPVSVANYHDLKKVFEATDHHYYIDHKDVIDKGIEPKIYINDYTTNDPATSKNGLDLLKSLYDLSVLSSYTDANHDGIIDDGTFAGHKPLDKTRVGAGKNLEFFLRSDIDHSSAAWTPIANGSGECFEGTFHGDGHHLSGLNNSLFGHLCGDVYNLGVSGSFTGAGVADGGSGYVENCWINTTGSPDGSVYAIFGNPEASGRPKQIVNCYAQEGKTYKTTPDTYGLATPKPQQAFYNGEVAYDLNGFYLYKRYSDKQTAPTNADVKAKEQYQHYIIDADNRAVLQPVTYYAVNSDNLYSSTGYLPSGSESVASYEVPMYVEDRFADGDFRYAAGTIPSSRDERLYIDTGNGDAELFFPIWPDDYIFFGQKLTYGYSATDAHQEVPKAIARDGGRLSQNPDANRVYRAPAYFRPNTNEMSMAHFNPEAYLLGKSYDGTKDAYPGMTAIDFAGQYAAKPTYGQYGRGPVDGLFYPPMLDDDGLTSIMTRTNEKPAYSQTQNLLVYAPAETAVEGYANKKTFDVLTDYFVDPNYSDYYDNTKGYRLVGRVPMSAINGHIVQSTLKATNDHVLVDKQDFSCPIEYSFDDSYLMLYQRLPDNDNYIVPEWSTGATPVRTTKGWEGVSLPFTAELVTTDQKGEITHFYDGSEVSKNGTGSKIGHEYWLRQYRDITGVTGDDAIREARFTYPTKQDGNYNDKTVTNTFLWDYYYLAALGHNQQDWHNDQYPNDFYRTSRNYNDYAMLTAGTPYIIGFPGSTYYEFDLSGTFFPTTTANPNPARLTPQTVSFASAMGATIHVSYNELATGEVTKNGYTFKPSYLNEELPTGTYVMNDDGNAYNALSDVAAVYSITDATYATEEAFTEAGTLYTDAACTTVAETWADASTTYYKRTLVTPSVNDQRGVTPSQFAFRPYFKAVSGGGAKEYKNLASSIIFSRETSEMFNQEEKDDISNTGDIIIRAKNGRIFVTSMLQEAKDITIVTSAGALIDRYTIQPGDTRETKVNASGVYIVNKKKIAVKIKD